MATAAGCQLSALNNQGRGIFVSGRILARKGRFNETDEGLVLEVFDLIPNYAWDG